MTKHHDRLAEYHGITLEYLQHEPKMRQRGQRITAAVKKEESKEEFSRSEREKRVSKFPSTWLEGGDDDEPSPH